MYNRNIEFGLGLTGAILGLIFCFFSIAAVVLSLIFGHEVAVWDIIFQSTYYGYYPYEGTIEMMSTIIPQLVLLTVLIITSVLGVIGAFRVKKATDHKDVTAAVLMMISGSVALISCNVFGLFLVASGIILLTKKPSPNTMNNL